MAKRLLEGYTIGGDIIDQISQTVVMEPTPKNGTHHSESSNSGGTIVPPESPTAGGRENTGTVDVQTSGELATQEAPRMESVVSLHEVSVHYERTLQREESGIATFDALNITDPLTVASLRLGYADGSLLDRVGTRGRAALTKLGLLNAGGLEVLADSLVLPLWDDLERVSGFVSVALGGVVGTGLVNRRTLFAFREEIIVAESAQQLIFLLARSVTNVVFWPEAEGDAGLHALQEARVQVVALVGETAQERASPFIQAGFGVKVARAVGDLSRTEVQRVVHSDASVPTFRREGPGWVYEHESRRYQLVGVPETASGQLRITMRARYGNETSLDHVDLYSARSRSLFAAGLAQVSGFEIKVIERDLLLMVDQIEHLWQAPPKDTRKELTPEERAVGLAFLKDPELTNRIVDDLEAAGYVGERVNKLLVYLAATSRKLADPISVWVISQSASGKSRLIDTVKSLMPIHEVVSLTSLSEQALNYLGEEGLLHKFLVMGEAVHSEGIEHQIREMLSAKELSRLVTTKDPKTGNLSSALTRKRVLVSLALSGTKDTINPENASRFFLVHTDESREQTRAVMQMQKHKYGLAGSGDRQEIIARHHAAQQLLAPLKIVNPFVEALRFPDEQMRFRRDHERFLDLIAVVCFLRQYQKERREHEGRQYIECDLHDYEIAHEIMQTVLVTTAGGLPESVKSVYERMRVLCREKGSTAGLLATEASVSQREIREAGGFQAMAVKRAMRQLWELEYVQIAGAKARGGRLSYRLVADDGIEEAKGRSLATVEDVQAWLKGNESSTFAV